MKKLKKMLKNNPKIHFFLYKMYLPIKRLKNRKNYNKHYSMCFNKLKALASKKKIIYIGIPIHSNLGDLAQYYCIRKWLVDNYSEYEVVEIPDNVVCHNHKNILNKMKTFIKSDDIFVFQSGYRTTDVANFEGEYAHQEILKNFKNKVLVFPQTVNFKYDKEINKSCVAYEKNNNYLFLARDEISYDTARKMYDKDRVLLYPDIVTSLIGNCDIVDLDNDRDGILFCLRDDEEKLYTDVEYSDLMDKLKTVSNKIERTDTNSQLDFEFDRTQVEKEISLKLNQFSKYKLIITDRYHGTIFSLISNTPVIVLNSTDHKLSSGVNWFKGVYDDFVYYCNDLKDVSKLAKEIYDKDNTKIIKPHFNDKYYSKLNDKFKKKVK